MSVQESPRNDAVDAMTARFVDVSLHTGDPGTTGDNEVSGGDYTRAQASWSSASGGLAGITQNLVFQVPAGNEVTHLGMWDSSTGWTASAELNEPQPFNNDGELTVQELTVTIENI